MNCSPKTSLVFSALLLGLLGCSAYRYMKDSSPEIERARQEYVVNNPGNRYNQDIAAGRVRRGMSRLQVHVAWGDADRVQPGRKGTATEVWEYEEDEVSRGTCVYRLQFDGEILTRLDAERAAVELPSGVDRSAADRREKPTGSTTTGGKRKPDLQQ